MGRNGGKLIPFLRNGLDKNLYSNLKYESQDVFYLLLPRYERSKPHKYQEYHKILKDWYKCQGKPEKYISYSTAKAVLQVSLKKSVYLVALSTIKGKLRFKFATSEETEEKRKLLKEKEKLFDDDLFNQSGPPSTSSSGYGSSEETAEKNSEVMECHDNSESCLIDDLEKYFEGLDVDVDLSVLDNFFNGDYVDDGLDNNQDELEKLFKSDGESIDFSILGSLSGEQNVDGVSAENDVGPPVQYQDLEVPAEVQQFYWQFSEKKNCDSVLLLTFTKQFFNNSVGNIKPGNIVIPNEILEKRSYIWQNAIVVDKKLFVFFQKT